MLGILSWLAPGLFFFQVFTDMPGGGLKGEEVEVVITGDALVQRCPAVTQRIGEDSGELATLGRMQVV